MQLYLFCLRNYIGKMTLSSPVELDWQAAAKEGKWFSKSDLSKTISCTLTGLLLLQVLQEKQINSTALVLNKSIIKIPKHGWYCSSKQTQELRSFIDAPSMKGLCFTLFEGPESPYYFCLQKHCGAHERDTEGKKPFFFSCWRENGWQLIASFFFFSIWKSFLDDWFLI